jgi:tight adherence protein C
MSLTDPLMIALLTGGALGAAVWLFAIAVRPPRVDLVTAAGGWEQRRKRYPLVGEAEGQSIKERAGEWLVRETRKRGITFTSVRHNLALLDRTLEAHLVSKLMMAGFGLILPTVLGFFLVAIGIGIPLLGGVGFGLILAAAFWFVPDSSVRELAANRRSDLRRALACYLDLVAMSLAGGRGIPEALPSAAAVGQGWGFELIAQTLATARSSGTTPWMALADLGERTGLPELQDLGSALRLVANDGARVRESLSSRASSQRRRQLAEAEGDAKKAHQGISQAQIVLMLGFLIFLGYPAVVNIFAL